MSRTAASVDLQPIDRLEEKVRALVGVIDALRADRAKAQDDVVRLERELEGARARLGEAASTSAELGALRDERDQIRARVAEMIAQIDKLNL